VPVLALSLIAQVPASALAGRTVRLEAGTVIPVRLNDTLSSSDSHKGDTFTTTVRSTDTGDYGLPEGTNIDGVVTGVRPQRDKDPGIIELAFRRVQLPDGRSYPIEGSLIGLDNKSVDRRSDGRLIAKPAHKNDRLTYAGYGAGAGLIVGLLTKRPLEDALLGGLLGYGFSALQKGHSDARDVVLKPGAEMGVRMDRQAVLTTYQDERSDRDYRNSDRPRYHYSDRADYGVGGREHGETYRSDQNLTNYDPGDIGVMIDDRDVRFDSNARPILSRNDVVLVPVAPVLRAAKVPYTYNGRYETLRATGTLEPVRLTVGSSIAVHGDRRIKLEGPVQRINGTLYVPMKALALATGYDVHYDSGSRTVVLISR